MLSKQPNNLPVLPMLRSFRILGWGFVIIGNFAFVHSLLAFRDPTAVIVVNHGETSDPHTKLVIMLTTAAFPLIGAILAFTPRRHAEKFLAAQLQRCRELRGSLRKDGR
jgi:hypothetical protein